MTPSLQLQTCRPVTGGAVMTPGEWRPLLAQLTGWTVAADVLEKRFEFPDFQRTMAFINGVAEIANAQDHHPDMLVSYGRCTLRWSTHSVGGLSINDFICAARVDAMLA